MSKKYPGSIYKRSSTKRLIIEYRGEKISTGLPDCKENRKIAEQMLWTLWRRHNGMEPAESREIIRRITTPDEAWHEYEKHLRAAERSDNTIRAYRDAFIKMKPNTLRSHDVESTVQQFVQQWTGAPGSINIHLRNYEAFLNWCVRKKYIDETPDLKMYRRRGVEKEVQVLTAHEVSTIVKHLEARGNGELALLVEFLYETGLRIGEALTLRPEQRIIINETPVLRISNKVTKRPEYLPLSRHADAIISGGRKGKVFSWSASSASTLTRRFNEAMKANGIADRSGFHILRKSFRHRLQVAGVSVDVARRLMRHSNIRVTDEHYTIYQVSELADALNTLTPK